MPRSTALGSGGDPLIWLGLAAATLFFVATGAVAFVNFQTLKADSALVVRSGDTLTSLEDVLSSVKDAETGQRGYLLTDRETYLEPYNNARADIPGELQELRRLTANNPRQQELLSQVQRFTEQKLSELQESIVLKRSGNAQGALALLLTDRGKLTMDRIRDLIDQFLDQERVTLAQRVETSRQASELTLIITSG